MLIGNLLFSPDYYPRNTINFFIFTINKLGLTKGIIGALKRDAMIIISFAWLSSIKTMDEIYYSLNIIPIKNYNKYLLIFLKHIINQKFKLQTQYYSLKIRGIVTKTSNLRRKIFQSSLLLKSLFNRFFYDIGKLTYAGESHFINHIDNQCFKPNILLKKVSVFYDNENELIIKDIDLSIEKKSLILLCGDNKAGKTTLLRVISGYIPTITGNLFGSVSICDIEFSENLEINDIAKFVKYIMDEADEYIIGLTVSQEIMLHTDDIAFAKHCLKLMKIDHLWNRETSTLSGGEKVRLVLASLLASKAKIILLDSVLSQLDEIGRKEFIDALDTFYKNNNCIIVVADYHIQYYFKLANRYIFLKNGRIVYDHEIPFDSYEKFMCIYRKYYESYESPSNKIPTCTESSKSNIPIVELKNVSVKFDDKLILNKLNLSIKSSECMVITGPNGSGKTTAMLILAGIRSPDSGERIVNVNPFNLGYVFQNASFQIVGSTVEDELKIGPLLRNWTEHQINSFIKSKSKYISVNLNDSTITLHQVDLKFLAYAASDIGLDLIIFDEPTTYMDNKDLNKFFEIINHLQKIGVAIIIVTHDERILKRSKQVVSFMNIKYGK